MKIAITGASGKTGYRISEEAIKKGYKVRQIIRKNSKVSEGLENLETIRVSLDNKEELDKALKDIDALVIATGARASLDLTGPAKVDALGVYRQLESCKRVGISRVILVSSLCTGKLFHPLNLFGLILIWKKIGENFLRNSNFEWTIIRPGGLKENEDIKFSILLKLFILPFIVFLLSKLLNFDFYQSSAVILQAGTPTAISTILMAEAYDVKQKIASKILFTTTLISIVTIPLLKMFINLFIQTT